MKKGLVNEIDFSKLTENTLARWKMFLHLSKGKHFPSFLVSFLMPFLCQLSLVSQDPDRPASNMADFPQPDGRSKAEDGAKLDDSIMGQGGVGFWLSQSAS